MSADYLCSWFERVERNREERKDLTDFERGLFTEAKSNGYDGKALRKVLQRRAMGDAALAEMDALVEAYEAALGAKAVAAELIRGGASVRQAAEKTGIGYGTARRAKNTISGSPEPDRAATSGAPAGAGGEEAPQGASPRPDPIHSSTGGGDIGAGTLPTAAAVISPAAVPPVEPDANWHVRDGHDGYVLALQVGNGHTPHPGECDTAMTRAVVERCVADAGPLPAFLDRRRV